LCVVIKGERLIKAGAVQLRHSCWFNGNVRNRASVSDL